MTKPKRKRSTTVAHNRPTEARAWWFVDTTETRTLRVRATGPKHARDLAIRALADLYPPASYLGEPDVVRSFAHTVKCSEGRQGQKRVERVKGSAA